MKTPPFAPTQDMIRALQSGRLEAVDELYASYREPFFGWAGKRFDAFDALGATAQSNDNLLFLKASRYQSGQAEEARALFQAIAADSNSPRQADAMRLLESLK